MKNQTPNKELSSLKKQLKIERAKAQIAINIQFIKKIHFYSGYKLEMEYVFTKVKPWKLDFAIPSLFIAIEVEGGVRLKTTFVDKKTGRLRTHIGGRHNSPEGFLKDMVKYNELASDGWTLVRTTPEDLFSDKTLEIILKCINLRIHHLKKIS